MILKKIGFYLIGVSIILFACDKDDKITPLETETHSPGHSHDEKSNAVFNFDALMDNLPLIANTKWYLNANGDSFTVARFNYYISNIKLKRDNGSVFSEVESYHVIKHFEGSKSFTVTDIPVGDYNQIEFTIGVDSARNVSGAQTGPLSQSENMFWSWSTGYIFLKLEGEFRTPNVSPGATYAIHTGGFSGKDNCLRNCTFNLSNKLSVQANKTSKVFYDVSVNEFFSNPVTIDLDTYFVIATGAHGKTIANNYKDMFVINHIEN